MYLGTYLIFPLLYCAYHFRARHYGTFKNLHCISIGIFFYVHGSTNAMRAESTEENSHY